MGAHDTADRHQQDRRWKQPQPQPLERAATSGSCPSCWTVLSDGLCHWCDHGCRHGCGPLKRYDGSCPMCGEVTFRCPGEGCRSPVHAGEPA